MGQLVALLVLVGWGALAGFRVERRLVRSLIRWARGRAWRGGLAAVGVQLAALAGFGLASLVAAGAGRLVGRPLLVGVEVVALLAYTPVLMTALPNQFTLYGPARREMQRAGASRGVARAIAWSGGPVALVGMVCVFVALFEMVLPS